MKQEVVQKFSDLITAGFGLVAALAWNEAIQSLFKEDGPLSFLAARGTWGYAVFVTILAVILTLRIGRLAQKAKGKPKEEPKNHKK